MVAQSKSLGGGLWREERRRVRGRGRGEADRSIRELDGWEAGAASSEGERAVGAARMAEEERGGGS